MSSTVVTTHEQLAEAVANLDIDTIIFGADIELEDGITIPAERTSLIFDGENDGTMHMFTDVDILLPEYTLNVDAASSVALTFRNMHIIGRNFYGIPHINEAVDTSGVSVSYENITYTGPQLVFNPLGLTCFENCNITIVPPNGHEVGEVCKVEFKGENTISHNSTNDSTKAVFWFKGEVGAAYFMMHENSSLTVDTVNFFMHSYDIIARPVRYQILQNASFTLNTNTGISHHSTHRASSFLVDTGATFRYTQAESNLFYASLYLNEGFTVNKGATVYMQAPLTGANSLIYFISGTNFSFDVNNPKSFVLYDNSSATSEALITVSRNYSITAEQINHWTTARAFPDAGTFDDTPQSYWHNPDWTEFSLYGNLSSSSTTVFSSGLDNPQYPITNFRFQDSRVISAGNLLISPDPIIDNGRPITGQTEPNAKMIISFTIGEDTYTFDDITAGADGRFVCNHGQMIPVDTEITISANTPFLIKTITATAVPTGDITIVDAPVKIAFSTPPIARNPVLLRRLLTGIQVEVNDTRPYPTQWQLLASITGPLTTANGESLENAVVYRDDDEMLWDLSADPIPVYSGEAVMGRTYATWDEDKGILVRITGSILSRAEYTTELIWALEVADDNSRGINQRPNE